MTLTLITGPAGSGKTGEVLERFAAGLERESVMVVPTVADVQRFEDELLARRPVAVGGRILTFERLFELAATATGARVATPLTAAQRRAVLGAVTDAADLRALARPARRGGFVEALDTLVGELRSARISPEELEARLGGGSDGERRARHLEELSELYGTYEQRCARLGRSDAQGLAVTAVAALEERPEAWGGRPVAVHGFDDLTPVQLALLRALARQNEVVVSVVHEPARAPLVARRRLVEQLERLMVATPNPGHSRMTLLPREATGLLSHIERSFLAEAPSPHVADGALRLLDSAGLRNEVEQVGAQIVSLLRSGVASDQIAVIARSPVSCAAVVDEIFRSYGIPAAIHADRSLGESAVGRGILGLCRAVRAGGRAADVVAFLRTPGVARIGRVDRLEQAIRVDGLESADDAVERWHQAGGRKLWELDALREAAEMSSAELAGRAAGIVRRLFEHPRRRRAELVDQEDQAEAAVAEVAARTLEEVAEVAAADAALGPDLETLPGLLEAVTVPRSRGSVGGRVEVMSPYRARARQYQYVFVISLQEGEFPRRGREDPFLSVAEREAAGLPELADVRDEERYLFYVALTRATHRLYLSFRSTDDQGTALSRSFLVDEVLDLLPAGAEAALTTTKPPAATVFEPEAAPTRRELARALAERRDAAPLAGLGTSRDLASWLEPRLETARERADRLPGPLSLPFVLERFSEKTLNGASSLESYAECPFRYFVQHELSPRELAPAPEPLARGGAIHAVLERLYDERGDRPTPETLPEFERRGCELLGEEVTGTGLDPARRPAARAVHRRMESDLLRFLRHDAEHSAEATLYEIEAGFGERDDDRKPPLELGGFALHGKIDRIDLLEPGVALVRDYKSGASVPTRKEMETERRLQLPLYMLAVRELWGLDPAGGLYHALGDQKGGKARGLLRGPKGSSVGEPVVDRDYTDDADDFEQSLQWARQEAEGIAQRIRSGYLAREPLEGKCPRHCDYHPICRRERGEKNPESQQEQAEEADE